MNNSKNNERLVELLIDRATVGLSAAEDAELSRLLAEESIDDDYSFDYIAHLLLESEGTKQTTGDESEMKSLPDHIRSQVVDTAEQHLPEKSLVLSSGSQPMHRNRREILAWFAAAACLAIAAFAWSGSTEQSRTDLIAMASADELDKFIRSSEEDDLVEVDLKQGTDSVASGASGKVFWNRKTKRGFVRIDGLSVNDSAKEQYQLWIIDKERGIEDRPNAGVFDISSDGMNVFTFSSDLEVFQAQGFAVTVEKPGGVAVSDLSRIALVNLDGSSVN